MRVGPEHAQTHDNRIYSTGKSLISSIRIQTGYTLDKARNNVFAFATAKSRSERELHTPLEIPSIFAAFFKNEQANDFQQCVARNPC